MSRTELLNKATNQDIKSYIETWERVTVDQDPLLKRWKEHVDDSKKKCSIIKK